MDEVHDKTAIQEEKNKHDKVADMVAHYKNNEWWKFLKPTPKKF